MSVHTSAGPHVQYRPIPGAAPRGLVAEFMTQANPAVFLPVLWRHRYLIRQLTWREVTGRYRSSALGFAWSLVTPLVMLSLYTFVFGLVLKARWPGTRAGNLAEFGLMLFAGLTAFSLFSECVNRAPSLITSSPNYVKKVVFPLEVLPVSVLGSALFHTAISALILVVAQQLVSGTPVWTAVFMPLVLLPLACLALGVSWFLASLGVFLRDIGHTVNLVMQVLFFMTPIFYAPEALPSRLQLIVRFNPLAPIVNNMRRVGVLGQPPRWEGLAFSMVVGFVVLCLGHAWFAKSKPAFADVI
jgi:lipopolysaccharide transport system permease protein